MSKHYGSQEDRPELINPKHISSKTPTRPYGGTLKGTSKKSAENFRTKRANTAISVPRVPAPDLPDSAPASGRPIKIVAS